MSLPNVFAVIGLSAAALVAGCNQHRPNNGGMWSHTGGPQTIASTENSQKSVRMTDLRSGEVFFAMDIPPGKQLTFDFDRDEGDDAVYTPDIMRYEVKDLTDTYGKLTNAMTVPNEASRKVDVFVTQGVAYQPAQPEQTSLRTDRPEDRPDWWTPRGGALPDSHRGSGYDN
jgi:hypothetical protein